MCVCVCVCVLLALPSVSAMYGCRLSIIIITLGWGTIELAADKIFQEIFSTDHTCLARISNLPKQIVANHRHASLTGALLFLYKSHH